EGVAEGFFPRRLRVAENPGHETDQRFNGGHGRDLAASEDEVPERKLEIDKAPYPLIEPLITAADEDERGVRGELLSHRGLEHLPLRREKDAVGPLAPARFEAFHCLYDAVNAHHHAGAPAIRSIVDTSVFAEAVLPQVLQLELEEPRAPSPPDEARLAEGPEELGE